jgi:hypothetical protein
MNKKGSHLASLPAIIFPLFFVLSTTDEMCKKVGFCRVLVLENFSAF